MGMGLVWEAWQVLLHLLLVMVGQVMVQIRVMTRSNSAISE